MSANGTAAITLADLSDVEGDEAQAAAVRTHVEHQESALRHLEAMQRQLEKEASQRTAKISAMALEINAESERHTCEMDLLGIEIEACGAGDEHASAAAAQHEAQLAYATEVHDAEAAHIPSLLASLDEVKNRTAAERQRHALIATRCKAELTAAVRELEDNFRVAFKETNSNLLKKAFEGLNEESQSKLIHNQNLREESSLQTAGKEGFDARRHKQQADLAAVEAEVKDLKAADSQAHAAVLQLKAQLRKREATIVDLNAHVQALETSRQEATTAAGRASRNVYRVAPTNRNTSAFSSNPPNKTISRPKANLQGGAVSGKAIDTTSAALAASGGAGGATTHVCAEIDAETSAAADAAAIEVKKIGRIASKWHARTAEVRKALLELRNGGGSSSNRDSLARDWVAIWEHEDRRPRSPNAMEAERKTAAAAAANPSSKEWPPKQAVPRPRVRSRPGLLTSSSSGAAVAEGFVEDDGGLTLPRVPSAAETSHNNAFPGGYTTGASSPLPQSLLERLLRDNKACASGCPTKLSSSSGRQGQCSSAKKGGRDGKKQDNNGSSKSSGGGMEGTRISRAATTPARAGGVGGAWDRPGWPTAVSAAGHGFSSADDAGGGGRSGEGKARPSAHALPLPLQVAQAKALHLLSALPDFPVSLQGRLDLTAANSSGGGGLALTKDRRKPTKGNGASHIPKRTSRA